MGLTLNITVKSSDRPEAIKEQVASIVQQMTGASPQIRMNVLNNAPSRNAMQDVMSTQNINPWEQ